MAKTNPGNTEKNLLSRRTLLNNGLLTGLTLATGIYLKKSSNIPVTTEHKPDLKNGGKSGLAKSEGQNNLAASKSNSKKNAQREETYIDHFDC